MKTASYINEIYELVALVPEGRVTTYGHIAGAIPSSTTPRMVGWALNKVHFTDLAVPAHRVVNRNGLLTGRHHFATPDRMQELLESEGIKIENHQVQNFDNLLWDPQEEIQI